MQSGCRFSPLLAPGTVFISLALAMEVSVGQTFSAILSLTAFGSEPWLVPCLNALATGDLNRVSFSQGSHLLRQTAAIIRFCQA